MRGDQEENNDPAQSVGDWLLLISPLFSFLHRFHPPILPPPPPLLLDCPTDRLTDRASKLASLRTCKPSLPGNVVSASQSSKTNHAMETGRGAKSCLFVFTHRYFCFSFIQQTDLFVYMPVKREGH